ncbi:N-formylglutamate amidohydrolase [soil metagenome]
MPHSFFRITSPSPDSPFVAAAIHDGHQVREELLPLFKLPEQERLREEDPFTASWATIAPTQIIGLRSRFEVDLNRPRVLAVYQRPEDAWGLEVWQAKLEPEVLDQSLELYDAFYREVRQVLSRLVEQHGYVVIYDLHTYNHKREGPAGPPADPAGNPEVNLGTANLNRELWAPVVDGFIRDLQAFDFQGRQLDVRENVKFKGGYFSKWVQEQFGDRSCTIAIEFKKFFMDEWTGEPDQQQIALIRQALQHTVPGMLEAGQAVGTLNH